MCYNGCMITCITAPTLSAALKKLGSVVKDNEGRGARTVIFCEDRLTLAAERAVCAAVGGTFSTAVYTFARFLSARRGKYENLLTSQGSAMVVRRLIEENRQKLTLFKKLSAATAAQDVYDTIALLYSSRVTPGDLASVTSENPLLEGKLRDLELLYRAYSDYLEESSSVDRNRYLAMLPEVIASSDVRGAEVIFLGFQAFTCSVAECASACMDVAKNVTGLFIGGKEEVYVNEASASFLKAAANFGGANRVTLPSDLIPAAERLRRHIFDPECFHTAGSAPSDNIFLFAGGDEEEELEYIACNILKYALEGGVRYREISVMLPDMQAYAPKLSRVFSEYGIPFYLDIRYPLSTHPVSAFLEGFLNCAADGCTKESVLSVVNSPLFFVESLRPDGKPFTEGERRKDKDLFCNYMLRLAGYRGGVKREPKEEILSALGLDISAVRRVREPLLKGVARIPSKGDGRAFCAALRAILSDFSAESVLRGMANDFADEYPSLAAFSGRAFESLNAVIDEAERLTSGSVMPVREFARILKSGLAACELSLIPPKQDAVFVGDLLKCANTGSEVVFVAGLTGDVPSSGDDTSVLTDRDITSLESLNIIISPKIQQVNSRLRETAGLNLAAFRRALHLSYPVRKGGEEGGVSVIVDYAKSLFVTPSGSELPVLTGRAFYSDRSNLKYLVSRPAPALRRLAAEQSQGVRAAIYSALCANGYEGEAQTAIAGSPAPSSISNGAPLYGTSFSPTVLETYFSCPYKCFMLRGLKLAEREEGVMRPLDCGNFIHTVLQKVFSPSVNSLGDREELRIRAEKTAEELLADPKYSSLSADKRGEYAAARLVEESVQVCLGAFEQLKNSTFSVEEVEKVCRMPLDGNLSLYGRIDRVDSSGDMVRVIDYKTGAFDCSAPLYYMGLKLQLPLYLSASARGRRAVGAYYFPAGVTFEGEHDGVFRLKGYMDGSEEVIKSTDTTISEKQKSKYVDVTLGAKLPEGALGEDEFADFLTYSTLVSRMGAREMSEGNVAPSPAFGACEFCKLSGSCGFAAGLDLPREKHSVKCSQIAHIVRKERGDE